MSCARVVALNSATGQLTSDSRRLPCHTGRAERARGACRFSFEGLAPRCAGRAVFLRVFGMMFSCIPLKRNAFGERNVLWSVPELHHYEEFPACRGSKAGTLPHLFAAAGHFAGPPPGRSRAAGDPVGLGAGSGW